MDEENNNPNIKSPDEIVIEETETTIEPVKTEPVTEPKPKKRVGLSILIIILILLLIGGALAAGYLWGNNTVKPADNTGVNSSTNNTSTDEETELTDATLKKDINQKVAYLHWIDGVTEDPAKIARMSGYNSPLEKIYTNSIDDDRKIETVLLSLSTNFTPVHINLTPEEYAVAKSLLEQRKYDVPAPENESIDNTISQRVTAISADVVSQRYYDLFGEELSHHSLSVPAICANVYYSESTNSYLRFPVMCGGTSAGQDAMLQEKITKQGDNVFVYYRASSAVPDLIANDFSFQEGRTAVDGISTSSAGYGNSLINDMENNPSNYAEYRLVFEKNDKGTYSFKRAEKIE